MRSIVAVAAAVLVAASVSGATEQPPASIETAIPAPHFVAPANGPFSAGRVREAAPLGAGAPPWARRLYRTSIRVLFALTDARSGALIAGERDGWDYVWPRDAAAGAIALEAAGLRPEARRVAGFLSSLDADRAARFYPDGSSVPGRPAAGDGEGWVAAAERIVLTNAAGSSTKQDRLDGWRDRQDYGENVTGDLLGNAIAAGVPAAEIDRLLNRETAERPRTRAQFSVGESVKVVSGPLSDFSGEIAEINEDASKLKVLVSIFGRETPVEVGFDQVKKI